MATTWSSPVLLGLYDSTCPGSLLSPYESKIGGYPDFFSLSVQPSPPCCQLCHKPLLLLVQVYCPLESSPYHRVLHVFCCRQPECWTKAETWCVIRSQMKDPSYTTLMDEAEEKHETISKGFSASDWCDGADDWGSGSIDDSLVSEFQSVHTPTSTTVDKNKQETTEVESKMRDLSLEESKLSMKDDKGFLEQQHRDMGAYYPPCYISVIEEPTENDSDMKKVKELLVKYQKENPYPIERRQSPPDGLARKGKAAKSKSTAAAESGSEGYEKTIAKHGDRYFQKFYKQMLRCPNQIMRYCFRGDPLIITNNYSAVQPSTLKCKYCGAESVFELQLMPPLVYILQQQTKNSQFTCQLPVVEFGTVLVYTCSDSCWSDSDAQTVREEYVFVQQDPDNISMQKICDQT